jgi:hypothetical protein
MSGGSTCDEELIRRLPLPLARLYRHAYNAKSPLDRHQCAYYLWEAALKLLGSSAAVVYAESKHGEPAPAVAEALTRLARPALGDWWRLVRLLTAQLANDDDAGFRAVHDLLLVRTRDDMPRAAGLDAALRETLDHQTGPRTTVRLSDLFDRLVRYRNREIGHGAAGQRSGEFYDRYGRAILLGVGEILGRLDVLASRRLVYVAEIRKQPSGPWLIDRYDLVGEVRRRLDPMEQSDDDGRTLRPDSLCLEANGRLTSLGPMCVYEFDADEVLFLNARRGRLSAEYLGYSSGRVLVRSDLGGEQRLLLERALGTDVAAEAIDDWAARSHAEEGAQPEPGARGVRQIAEFELLSRLGQGGNGSRVSRLAALNRQAGGA